ncbi:MAG: NAD-dependent epimerase/dehydratase family protein, partial [Petrimonas sp.]|nr:NAD-dependent epimerase/dehydratase family protein [Petrimonas sp.]
ILHAAGKAHVVPKTEAEKKAFFDVNYQGTVNLCKALEKSSVPSAFIFISTVAVYGLETGEEITEEHPLNGDSPYALSKIQAEQFLMEWCKKNNVVLSILRPSLIAGPNPPGNLGAMIQGIQTGRYLSIAGGKARKSVLMVQDIAHLLPALIEKGGVYNVCDDSQPTFRELEALIAQQLNKHAPLSIPYWLAKSMALAGDLVGKGAPINSLKLSKITESLTFSNEKAKRELNWQPLNVLENFKIK